MTKVILMPVATRTGDALDCVALTREKLESIRERMGKWDQHRSLDNGVEAVEYQAGYAWYDAEALVDAGILEEEFVDSTDFRIVDAEPLEAHEVESVVTERCVVLGSDWAYVRCEDKHADGWYESDQIDEKRIEEWVRALDAAAGGVGAAGTGAPAR